MKYRLLGNTGLQVSEVGFGAWQLGSSPQWAGMSDALALELVSRAIDLGCNLFDTAPNYAQGNSERLLGRALHGRREQVILVSKFGHLPGSEAADFSVRWLLQSLEQSLERLGTDYLDVFLAHSPPREVLDGSHEIWPALDRARKQGKIRFYGASIDSAAEVDCLLGSTGAQVAELLFNMLQQDVRRSFARISDAGLGVIGKVPLDSGWLTGKYDANSVFQGVRERWSRRAISARADAVQELKNLLGNARPLSVSALAFVLSYPQVGCVIPGVRTRDQLTRNLSAAGCRLAPEEIKAIENCWYRLTQGGEALLPW